MGAYATTSTKPRGRRVSDAEGIDNDRIEKKSVHVIRHEVLRNEVDEESEIESSLANEEANDENERASSDNNNPDNRTNNDTEYLNSVK